MKTMIAQQRSPLVGYLYRRLAGKQPGNPTDAELLERFIGSGDPAAFELLVWRHERMVLAACRRLLRNAEDVEDAFQSTFLVLVRKASSISQREAVASWLYKVACRCALKARARAQRRNRHEQGSEALAILEARDDHLRAAEDHDLWQLLSEEIQRLPEKYRAPVVLCYLEGKTYAQAGHQLGCPRTTVSTRLTRAREILGDRLRARGVTVPATALVAVLCQQAARAAEPAALVGATVQAARAYAAESAAAGAVSAEVVALAEGVIKTMFLSKLKMAFFVLAVVGVVGAALGLPGYLAVHAGQREPSAATASARPKGGEDRPLPVWKERASVEYPDASMFRTLVFSPDGKALAAEAMFNIDDLKDRDGEVVIWDAATRKVRFTLPASERTQNLAQLLTVAFSSDGKTLATLTKNNKVKLWDAATGKERLSIDIQGPFCLRFAPDGKTLAVAAWEKGNDTGAIHLIDAASGKQRATFPGNRAAFSRDGATLATGGATREGAIKLWDVATGKEKLTLKGHGYDFGPQDLAFTPDGRSLVSGGNGTLKVWDLTSGKERVSIKHPDNHVFNLALSPDGRTVAVGGYEADGVLAIGHVVLYDVATGRQQAKFEADGGVFTVVAFSPDGKRLAAGLHTVIQGKAANVGFVASKDKGLNKAILKVWEAEQRPGGKK
jgi:RNA polymerase sigma factor (sigma-70 family)